MSTSRSMRLPFSVAQTLVYSALRPFPGLPHTARWSATNTHTVKEIHHHLSQTSTERNCGVYGSSDTFTRSSLCFQSCQLSWGAGGRSAEVSSSLAKPCSVKVDGGAEDFWGSFLKARFLSCERKAHTQPNMWVSERGSLPPALKYLFGAIKPTGGQGFPSNHF